MTPMEIIALVEVAAKLVETITANVARVKDTLSTDDLATLNGTLATLHPQTLALSAELDTAAANAA